MFTNKLMYLLKQGLAMFQTKVKVIHCLFLAVCLLLCSVFEIMPAIWMENC